MCSLLKRFMLIRKEGNMCCLLKRFMLIRKEGTCVVC